MNGTAGTPTPSTKAPYVYVNDKECALLEDYRLAVYQYFPDGTHLYDPAYSPPRRMVLGAEGTDEYGVTLRKLQPEGRYQAFFENPDTGVRYPVCDYTCLYLTNLPPATTPEVLGRYFEAVDLIKEADVFRGRQTTCDGRGWIVFQDTEKLAMAPRVLAFYGNIVSTHLSDQGPQRKSYAVSPPPGVRDVASSGSSLPVPRGAASRPPPPPMLGSSDGSPSSPTSPIGTGTTTVPQPRSSRLGAVPPRSASGFGLPASAGTSAPAGSAGTAPPPPPPPSGSSPVGESTRVPPLPRSSLAAAPRRFGPRSAFYTCVIAEADMASSLSEGVYRPTSPINEEELFAVEARGEVYLIMILDQHAAVFGVARLQSASRRRNRGLPVEWLSHGVYLTEPSLRTANGFSFRQVRHGAAVKPDTGARLFELADAAPSLPHMPENLPPSPGSALSGPMPPHSPMVPAPAGRGRGGGGGVGASSPSAGAALAAGQGGFAGYAGPPHHGARALPPPSAMPARKSAAGPFSAQSKNAMGPPKAVGDSPPAGPAIPIPASKRNAAAAAALGSATSADGPATPVHTETAAKGIPEIPKPASSAAAAAKSSA